MTDERRAELKEAVRLYQNDLLPSVRTLRAMVGDSFVKKFESLGSTLVAEAVAALETEDAPAEEASEPAEDKPKEEKPVKLSKGRAI